MADMRLFHAFTLCGRQVDFISDDVMVFRVGNLVTLFSISRREQTVLKFEEGYSLDCVVVNPLTKTLVVCLHSDKPVIRVYSFPELRLVKAIEYDSVFPWSLVAISRDSKRLVTISQQLNRTLVFWDLEEEKKLASTSIPKNIRYSFISFNPIDNEEFCTATPDTLHLWKFEVRFDTSTLERLEATLTSSREPKVQSHIESTDDSGNSALAASLSRHLLTSNWTSGNTEFLDSDVTLHYLSYLNSSQFKNLDFATLPVPTAAPAPAPPQKSAPAGSPAKLKAPSFSPFTDLDGVGEDQEGAGGKAGPISPTKPSGSKQGRRKMGHSDSVVMKPSKRKSKTISQVAMQTAMTDEEKKIAATRRILCHTWTTTNEVHAGTQYGEILTFKRITNPQTQTTILSMKVGKTPINEPIYSLMLSAHHLVAGSADGTVNWLSHVPQINNSFIMSPATSYVLDHSASLSKKAIIYCDFNPSYKSFVALTEDGRLLLASSLVKLAGNNNQTKIHSFPLSHLPLSIQRTPEGLLEDVSYEVDVIGSTNFMVGCGANGSSFVANFSTKDVVSSIQFPGQITGVSCSADGSLVAVGFADGVVRLLDATAVGDDGTLRLVWAERLQTEARAVQAIKFMPGSAILAVMQADRKIFFIRTIDLTLLGYTVGPANATCFDWVEIASRHMLFIGTRIGCYVAITPPEVAHVPTEGLLLPPSITKPLISDIKIAPLAFTTDPLHDRGFFAVSIDKKLKRFKLGMPKERPATLPEDDLEGIDLGFGKSAVHADKGEEESISAEAIEAKLQSKALENASLVSSKSPYLKMLEMSSEGLREVDSQWDDEHFGHRKFATVMTLSTNGELVASGGADGMIIIRRTADPIYNVKELCHDPQAGGVSNLSFSGDSRFLVSAGGDGGVFVWDINTLLKKKEKSKQIQRQIVKYTDPAALAEMDTLPMIHLSPEKQSFVESSREAIARRLRETENDQQDMVEAVNKLKERLGKLLHNNETVDERERMDRREFVVDLEAQEEARIESLKKAAVIREEIEQKNLSKQVLVDRLKTLCWDGMEVPETIIKGINVDQEVSNFVIRKLGEPALKKRQKINFLLKMQILEANWRSGKEQPKEPNKDEDAKDDNKDDAKVARTVKGDLGKLGVTTEMDYIMMNCVGGPQGREITAEELEPLGGPKEAIEPLESFDMEQSSNKETTKEKQRERALGVESGIDQAEEREAVLLYHPLSLLTTNRKISQIWLIQQKIERLKRRFNASFQLCLNTKYVTVENIQHKAKRINEITEELMLNEQTVHVQIAPSETPAKMLEVDDSEIKAERFVSEEEKAATEAKKAAEEGQKQSQEVQLRALDEMMGGTLEIKKDLALMAQEIERPAWMSTIPFDSMTEEQKQEVMELEKQEKALNAERETWQRLLETELKKLKNDATEITRNFNARLQMLFDQRVAVQKRILREEFVVLSLLNDLVEEEQIRQVELLIKKCLESLKEEKTKRMVAVSKFKAQLEDVRAAKETLVAEDKALDRNFKKDFAETGEHFETFYKLFKSRGPRPKPQNSSPATPGTADSSLNMDTGDLAADIINRERSLSADPFRIHATSLPDPADVYEPLAAHEMPSVEIDEYYWEGLQKRRKQKIEKEAELKTQTLLVLDMQKHCTLLEQKTEFVQAQITKLLQRQAVFENSRLDTRLNAEVMVKLRQGLVEIEESPVVTDLVNCVMVDRQSVEKLNEKIIKIGTENVEFLKEMMRSRNGINALQWERKRLELTLQDAEDLTKELQLLRVTKSLQGLIKAGGHDSRAAAEVSVMERKVEHLAAITKEETAEKKRRLAQYRVKIRQQGMENQRLDRTIRKLQALVKERQQLNQVRMAEMSVGDAGGGGELSPTSRKQATIAKKMTALAESRQLMQIARAQKDEMKRLQLERDRLRNATFPSFINAHKVFNMPDERPRSIPTSAYSSGAQTARTTGNYAVMAARRAIRNGSQTERRRQQTQKAHARVHPAPPTLEPLGSVSPSPRMARTFGN